MYATPPFTVIPRPHSEATPLSALERAHGGGGAGPGAGRGGERRTGAGAGADPRHAGRHVPLQRAVLRGHSSLHAGGAALHRALPRAPGPRPGHRHRGARALPGPAEPLLAAVLGPGQGRSGLGGLGATRAGPAGRLPGHLRGAAPAPRARHGQEDAGGAGQHPAVTAGTSPGHAGDTPAHSLKARFMDKKLSCEF